MRILNVLLILILAMLQYQLFAGPGNIMEIRALSREVAQRSAELSELESRNQQLAIEVVDLKQGLDTIEERARRDLGMIREGETFYLIVE